MTYPPGPGYSGPANPAGNPRVPPPQAHAPQPAFRPAPPGPPRPHRSYTGIILAGVAVLVVLAVAAGLAWHFLQKAVHDAGSSGFTPADSGRPIYVKLPAPCHALPKSILASLVPGAEFTVDRTTPAENGSDGPHATCQANMSTAEGIRLKKDRALRISMTAYPDDITAGVDMAKDQFEHFRSAAGKQAGASEGRFTYRGVEQLTGLDADAFAQDFTVPSEPRYAGTTINLRVENVYVELAYQGTDGRDARETPMAEAQARAGAETAAREVVKMLSSCPDCRN